MSNRLRVISAVSYTGIALLLAGLFFAYTSSTGKYDEVARFGGTAWVFLLTMIITMPTVTPFLKKRLQ